MSGKRPGDAWGGGYDQQPAQKKKKETKVERILRQVRGGERKKFYRQIGSSCRIAEVCAMCAGGRNGGGGGGRWGGDCCGCPLLVQAEGYRRLAQSPRT